MENFSVLKREEIPFEEHTIYDNYAMVIDKTVVFDDGKLELPFCPVFFRNLAFDLFLISKDQELYRINKYKKELEVIGEISDRILTVECTDDYIVILTEKEVLLFNSYFDLDKHIDLNTIYTDTYEQHSIFKVRFGNGVFVVITPTSMVILNNDLTVSGIYKEPISDAVFIKKYNIFACSDPKNQCIKFIEPNALEHGDQLDDYAMDLSTITIGDNQLLLLSNDTSVVGYYQKNFFWYKKFKLRGKFYSVEENTIIVKDNHLYKYKIYKERATNLVINGSILYYTNFYNAVIPPPYYYKSIECSSQIYCFYYYKNNLVVADNNEFIVYSIDEQDQIEKITTLTYEELLISPSYVFEVLLRDRDIVFRTESGIHKVNLLSKKVEECGYTKSQSVLKMYQGLSNAGTLGFFTDDGNFECGNVNISFDFCNKAGFDLQIAKDKIYFLNNGKLQTKEIDLGLGSIVSSLSKMSIKNDTVNTVYTDVSSFLIFNNYLLFISKNEFNVIDLNTKEATQSYAEEGMEILMGKENSILFSTRYGSIETITNRLFSLALIHKFIDTQNIKLAANSCDKNHIEYSVFIGNDGFEGKLINNLEDGQALSLFNCLKLPNEDILLECEIIKRLGSNFNPEFVTRDLLFNFHNTNCIYDKVISQFLCGYSFDTEKSHLENVSIMENNADVLDFITNEAGFMNINVFLNNLSIQKHFSTIVNVLILLNRVDLCFYLPSIEKVIKILLGKLSAESICKASINTFNLKKITLTHKLCQRDYTMFVDFYTANEKLKYPIYDFLGDRKEALFYLVESKLKDMSTENSKDLLEYAVKHNIIDQLMFYSYHKVFNFCFYDLIAPYKVPLDAFYLYKNSNKHALALGIAREHLFWREALAYDLANEVALEFVKLLIEKSRHPEAGEIVEKKFKDYSSAVELYVNGRYMKEALNLYKNMQFEVGLNYDNTKQKLDFDAIGVLIIENALRYSKFDYIMIKSLETKFNEYTDRLKHVRQRLNENMNASQTTFTYSSMKSTEKALIKDRPGGIYENEFVMNKIAKIVDEICILREKSQDIIDIFDEFGEPEKRQTLLSAFDNSTKTLRVKVEEIWNFEREDVDITLPNVLKPCLNRFFD